MKEANIPGEVSMVQAGAPQDESPQDDMTAPMLNTGTEHSSSDAGVTPATRKQQRCSPPDVIEAAASGDLPPQIPEDQDEQTSKESFRGQMLGFCIHHWEKAIILAFLITLIILVCVKGLSIFGKLLEWFQNQNNWAGWAIFLAMYTANVSLLLPGIVLILGAGFIFGFWKGLLAVWIGGGIGQSMAFLLARYLIGDFVSSLLRGKSRKWDVVRSFTALTLGGTVCDIIKPPGMVDRAMEDEGWKLLLLCRLSPLIPYNVLNITMASTKIHFWPFAIVSFFGVIPECAFFTYTGSLTENVSAIVSGKASPHGKLEYILGGISAFCLILTTIWATVIIRRALRKADEAMKDDEALQSMTDGMSESTEKMQPQVVAEAPETPDRHRRSLSQPLPRPYSPPIDHLGSSGQPWHELQEQPSPRSDASDPWDDKMQQWPSDAARKPHDKDSN